MVPSSFRLRLCQDVCFAIIQGTRVSSRICLCPVAMMNIMGGIDRLPFWSQCSNRVCCIETDVSLVFYSSLTHGRANKILLMYFSHVFSECGFELFQSHGICYYAGQHLGDLPIYVGLLTFYGLHSSLCPAIAPLIYRTINICLMRLKCTTSQQKYYNRHEV